MKYCIYLPLLAVDIDQFRLIRKISSLVIGIEVFSSRLHLLQHSCIPREFFNMILLNYIYLGHHQNKYLNKIPINIRKNLLRNSTVYNPLHDYLRGYNI